MDLPLPHLRTPGILLRPAWGASEEQPIAQQAAQGQNSEQVKALKQLPWHMQDAKQSKVATDG